MSNDPTTAVTATVNLYALAVDTQQWHLFDDVFTGDAAVDFGGGTRWTDLATLKSAFATIHAGYSATCHTTTNHVVVASGRQAHCLSYVHGRFFADLPGDGFFESGGWYDDHLVATAHGWRIARRTCRTVWSAGNPAVMGVDTPPTPPRAVNSLHRAAVKGKLDILPALNAAGSAPMSPQEQAR